MKIKLPDGQEIPYIRLQDARLDHVMRLQRETGWTMQEIGRQAEDNDVVTMALAYFLGMSDIGRRPKWKDIMRKRLSDFGQTIPEPGDDDDAAEGEDSGKEITASAAETTTESGESSN